MSLIVTLTSKTLHYSILIRFCKDNHLLFATRHNDWSDLLATPQSHSSDAA